MILNTSRETLDGFIHQTVSPNVTLLATDEHLAYGKLGNSTLMASSAIAMASMYGAMSTRITSNPFGGCSSVASSARITT